MGALKQWSSSCVRCCSQHHGTSSVCGHGLWTRWGQSCVPLMAVGTESLKKTINNLEDSNDGDIETRKSLCCWKWWWWECLCLTECVIFVCTLYTILEIPFSAMSFFFFYTSITQKWAGIDWNRRWDSMQGTLHEPGFRKRGIWMRQLSCCLPSPYSDWQTQQFDSMDIANTANQLSASKVCRQWDPQNSWIFKQPEHAACFNTYDQHNILLFCWLQAQTVLTFSFFMEPTPHKYFWW